MLFELKTVEAVKWLEVFAGSNGTARGNTYATMVKFVPTSFDMKDATLAAELARDPDLPEDAIAATKWIKPVERRNLGQRHAHLILSFTEPEYADEAIGFGLTIGGKNVQVQKLIQEIKRCNKPINALNPRSTRVSRRNSVKNGSVSQSTTTPQSGSS